MKTVQIQRYLAIISLGICMSGMLARVVAGIF
jgi:hypothetical protein